MTGFYNLAQHFQFIHVAYTSTSISFINEKTTPLYRMPFIYPFISRRMFGTIYFLSVSNIHEQISILFVDIWVQTFRYIYISVKYTQIQIIQSHNSKFECF